MDEQKYQKLSNTEIEKNLSEMNKWEIKNGKLYKEYIFQDFLKAIEFIIKISKEIDRLDHHPEIFNIYNKVTITLSTHDIQGISDYDFKLAKIIEKIM
ncbi:MAG: 4a-hydroxytetrahydrobiopterin dehydratase [Nitrososphaeraceae archaeon]